jgi:putative ribosome biogenesis GTPase RsgA
MKDYVNFVIEKIEEMSEEEFQELLIECGIEHCPHEEDNGVKELEKLVKTFEEMTIEEYLELYEECNKNKGDIECKVIVQNVKKL